MTGLFLGIWSLVPILEKRSCFEHRPQQAQWHKHCIVLYIHVLDLTWLMSTQYMFVTPSEILNHAFLIRSNRTENPLAFSITYTKPRHLFSYNTCIRLCFYLATFQPQTSCKYIFSWFFIEQLYQVYLNKIQEPSHELRLIYRAWFTKYVSVECLLSYILAWIDEPILKALVANFFFFLLINYQLLPRFADLSTLQALCSNQYVAWIIHYTIVIQTSSIF